MKKYRTFRRKHKKVQPLNNRHSSKNNKDVECLSETAKQRIESYVDQIVNDSSLHITYLPEAIERHLYRNIFRVILGVIDRVVKETTINVLGQQIRMTLV